MKDVNNKASSLSAESTPGDCLEVLFCPLPRLLLCPTAHSNQVAFSLRYPMLMYISVCMCVCVMPPQIKEFIDDNTNYYLGARPELGIKMKPHSHASH